MRVFIRKMTGMLCVLILLMGNAHICFADDLTDTEAFFTEPESWSGLVNVPGRGWMRYYAQNDPLWGGLCYERAHTSTRRPCRDAACGPFTAAMAVANLITDDEFIKIASYAKQEYSLCPCSVNAVRCNHGHARYVLTSQRDFIRFLPLAFADFATGNNTFGTVSRTEQVGTGTGFIHYIAQIYGLEVTMTSDYQRAVEALRAGDSVIAAASKGGVFTNTGHYVCLAAIDDEKLYILDPLRRTEYKTNQSRKLEIIQPGLVALTHENVPVAGLGSFMILHRPQ